MNKIEFKKLLNEILLDSDKILHIERNKDGLCRAIVYDGCLICVYTATDKNVVIRALASTLGVVSHRIYYLDSEGRYTYSCKCLTDLDN